PAVPRSEPTPTATAGRGPPKGTPMLDRLPPWLRHQLVIFGSTALGVALPLLAAHQDTVSVWLVTTLRLPTFVLPVVASVVGGVILRFTTATRQYGVGSTETPPAE